MLTPVLKREKRWPKFSLSTRRLCVEVLREYRLVNKVMVNGLVSLMLVTEYNVCLILIALFYE